MGGSQVLPAESPCFPEEQKCMSKAREGTPAKKGMPSQPRLAGDKWGRGRRGQLSQAWVSSEILPHAQMNLQNASIRQFWSAEQSKFPAAGHEAWGPETEEEKSLSCHSVLPSPKDQGLGWVDKYSKSLTPPGVLGGP